jgi:PqqD family protein of HPr-rel-A system
MKLAPDIASVETDGGLVLLDMRTGRYFQLNSTGTRILESLLDGETADRIAERLSDGRDVTPELVAADIERLLDQLRRKGLVTDARDS